MFAGPGLGYVCDQCQTPVNKGLFGGTPSRMFLTKHWSIATGYFDLIMDSYQP